MLKKASFPEAMIVLGVDGIRQILHDAKLRGSGYSRTNEILEYANKCVGLKDGTDAGSQAVKWFTE